MTKEKFKEANIKIIKWYLDNGFTEKDIEGIVWQIAGLYNAKYGGLNISCDHTGIHKVNQSRVGSKINYLKIFD